MVAGRGYPLTYREFVEMFPDGTACTRYLEQLRWPDGFICPSCGTIGDAWRTSRGLLVCPACRDHVRVGAGTIMDKTRTALTTWFEGAWLLTTAKNGMSAKTLGRTLGASYRVAWMMLHRFRVVMVRAEREPLRGDVEVDETFVGGGKQSGKRSRGAGKSIVLIALEVKDPKGFGRVLMRHVLNASAASLVPFVRQVVAPGSVLRTDGWRGYNPLQGHGYTRKKIVLSGSGEPPHVSMPGAHRVASLLKR